MSLTVTIAVHCDQRDADGYCGSVYRMPGASVPQARREARRAGWALGKPDLCPRCASRESSREETSTHG